MNPVRRALEFLITRVLRSRLGVAVALAVVILGIVATARLLAGPDADDPGLTTEAPPPVTTVDPSVGDDGVFGVEPPPSPTAPAGTPPPATVARKFATAWLAHQGVTAEQWHAGLRPYATEALLEKLAGVDPTEVPADRLTGEPVLVPQAEGLVEVSLPVDSGELRLELVAADGGRWLTDTVDWKRG